MVVASTPPSGGPIVGRGSRSSRCCVVLVGADDLDVEQHPGVVDAAQLGAPALEGALALGVIVEVLVRPGMTSILKKNAGTQNEWMTSGEWSLNLTDSSDREVQGRRICAGVPAS